MADILEMIESLKEQIQDLRDELRTIQEMMNKFDLEIEKMGWGDDP